jgi:hypothetical protein
MKRNMLPFTSLLALAILFTSCATRLGQTPDLAFYVADSAFDLANATVDVAFTFEQQNRITLWQLNPNIKRTLDKIRPEAWQVRVTWATARKEYKANPVPSGLTILQGTLAQMQRLAAAAAAALPQPVK